MSLGGSAQEAPLGACGSSTFKGLRSAGAGIVKASQRPSGDQARPVGDSVKWLIGADTSLPNQYTNSCVEPSLAAER